jgi:hypothetical protein
MIFSKVKRLHTANELLLQDCRGFYVIALTGLGVNFFNVDMISLFQRLHFQC